MGEDRAILLADVSGSTPLYERFGDDKASRMVFECVEGMLAIANKRGGEFVRSKGDDVLCLFEDPFAALHAVQEILDHGALGSVSVHAGLHWGPVLWRGNELFGGAINVAARLSSKAKINEVLISGDFTKHVEDDPNIKLRPMGEVTLRGTAAPLRIYALIAAAERSEDGVTRIGTQQATQVMLETRAVIKSTIIKLTCGEWSGEVNDQKDVSIGRSLESDLVLQDSWVSRSHASLAIANGIAELTDGSAAGCTIVYPDGNSYFIHRQTVALHGQGIIQLGSASVDGPLPEIHFEVGKRA